MAETALDVRHLAKPEAYRALETQGRAVLESVDDPVAAMATWSSLLHHGLGHLWTGFYRVVEPGRRLRVGPYQGALGCLDIAFGQGVCGAAAVARRTVIVPDVHAFPGHISCDARSRSEIVVPVFGPGGELLAVLDIDSERPAAFDEQDRLGLEAMMRWFSSPAGRAGRG
ncbi:MAG TPA: GAF domain-containing protein [Myxococcaceae bacterium]|jgi:GAF domain-containing protein|nr:GAF domain-containing protein [Myxococcaceae bacterium]